MSDIKPFAGFGLGLRREHYEDFLSTEIPVDFVEIISENYMVDGGRPLWILEQIRSNTPVVMHGVSMSIGSASGLDLEYLARLKNLAERIEPLWVSDHLCWTGTSAHNTHDLLPLPYTEEALTCVCDNIDLAQERLGRTLVLENPSSYLQFPENTMSEGEFIARMARRTGCELLLDLNNLFVSAHNHAFPVADYLSAIPMDRVRQIHLAGHTDGELKIDTHDSPVCDQVWQLYADTYPVFDEVATLIERDDAIPPVEDLLRELDRARALARVSSRPIRSAA
jgi:uncharacterized protein (UPF0276 family)